MVKDWPSNSKAPRLFQVLIFSSVMGAPWEVIDTFQEAHPVGSASRFATVSS
jgi:hypothetical protein